MPNLTNVTITKTKRIKDGKGEYGPWILYHFWIDDSDWVNEKFSYFQSGDKPTPTDGMELTILEFGDDKRGGYLADKLITDEEKPKPQPKPIPQNDQSQSVASSSSKSYYFAYAKDIVVAMINNAWKFKDVEHIDHTVRTMALSFYKTSESPDNILGTKNESEPNQEDNENPQPIGEFPLLFTTIPKKVIGASVDDVEKLLPKKLTVIQANDILSLLKKKEMDRDEFVGKVSEIFEK